MPKELKAKRAPKTVKEKNFVKAYLRTGNKVRSAMEAYPNATYKSASVIAHENFEKLRMDFWLDKAGLTNEVIAQAIAVKALTAKKRDQYSGEYDEDHAIQLRALEFAAKLKNLIQEAPINATQINNFALVWDDRANQDSNSVHTTTPPETVAFNED